MDDKNTCMRAFGKDDGQDGFFQAAKMLCSLFMPMASLLADSDRLSPGEASRRLTSHLREFFACSGVQIALSTDSGHNLEDIRDLSSFGTRRVYDAAMPLRSEVFPSITGSSQVFITAGELPKSSSPREVDFLIRFPDKNYTLLLLTLDSAVIGVLILENLPPSMGENLKSEDDWLARKLSGLLSSFIGQQRRRLLASFEASLLQALSDELPYGAFILSSRPKSRGELVINEVNPAACHLLGYSREELLRQSPDCLQDSNESRLTYELIEQLDKQPKTWESWLKRRDLSSFPAELTVSKMSVSGETLALLVCRDITTRHQTEQALRDSEERYALAARASNDGLWDWNLNTGEVYYAPRWYEMLGYKEHESRSDLDFWYDLVHNEDLPRLKDAVNSHLNSESEFLEIEYRIRHKDGSWRWMICHGLAVRDQDKRASRLAGSQSDITQRKHAEYTLLHDAFHDNLTNLPNRTLFMDRLKLSIARAKRNGETGFAILYVDIDRFKMINNTLGHSGGDTVIIRVASRLQAYLRSEDTLARLGGDDFAILFESVHNAIFATRLARRIQKALALPVIINHSKIYPSVSIGLTMYQPEYTRPEEMVRDAETAMYRAKAAGGSRYVVFDKGMHSQVLETLKVEYDLRSAIENNEFELFYQPMITLGQKTIRGFEALIRWRHPTRGLISPLDFIPTAEETGLIISIGEWVLSSACQQIADWHRAGHNQINVAINFSSRQFENHNMLNLVGAVMRRTGTPPNALEIEITESVAMKDFETSIRLLNELHGMGIRISIDDFGTGYSSLGYLKHFPINLLKIDRTFVSDIPGSAEDMSIIRAIIAMAHSLGLETLAEGIETKEQLAFLEDAGCNYAQGFLFSRPLDVKNASILLERGLPQS